jgi:hypothetical protein
VTGTNGTLTDTASLTVTKGVMASITIAPATATVSTDATQAYTAQGFDAHGNSLGDVTAGTTFSISGSGSCTGANCGSTTPGSYTVTGTNGSLTDTASLTVIKGVMASITISPSTSTITTDATQAYSAEGFDAHGNSLGNVTSTTTFDASGAATCAGVNCGSATPGTFTVTGTNGSMSDDASLTVTKGVMASIQITPSSATITTDATQAYSAEGFDAHGNSLGDVTGTTTFDASGAATCSGVNCGSATPGTFSVTGTNGTLTDTASLTVTNGALNHISISPATATITTDATQAYTATGFDAHGNSLGNVTASTTFTASGSATCTTNNCGSATPGTYTITGTDAGKTATATLTVTTGALHHITIAPLTATITTDATQAYTATGFDAHGNSLGNVTSSTTFTASGTATCSTNNCGATAPGTYTITGTDAGKTATATLNVTAGALDHITIAPKTATIATGAHQLYTAQGFDSHNNPLGDVTSATTFTASGSASCTGNNCTASTPGTYTITGTDAGKSDTATLTVVSTAGTISSFTPASGPVGTTVTITGTGFTGASAVRFNGTPASSFTVVSATKITAVVAFGSTTGKITVTTGGGVATSTTNFKVTPTVTSFTPAQGPQGTVVTITGSAFTGATDVKFGGTKAASFTVDSYSQITATVAAKGTGKITVTTADGTGTSTTDFTVTPTVKKPVVSSFSPLGGTWGTLVTITGTGFTGASAVTFGGVAASFTVVSATKITATVPNGSLTGKIAVTTSGGTGTSEHDFNVRPTITSFSPASGPIGTVVTINGTGFTTGSEVRFHGTLASSMTYVSATQIRATVAAGSSTGKIKVTTDGGSAESSTNFTKTK